MVRSTLVAAAVAAVGASAAIAQESPYTGYQGRAIKALSAEEVEGYLGGAGMGFALAAELNGYPGPKHVLELADSLGLDAGQREAMQDIRDRMLRRARELGAMVVEWERALDSLFSARAITPERLEKHTAEIGILQAEVRYVHLLAHLETVGVLTDEQVVRYGRLRGYGDPAHGDHRHGH
jgi:hypothetical protein